MPPVPPRRKTPPLLAPRDVTETARQGQGIGDLEAMRQMATTAILEVLRNAPVTSTPMSVFDMAKAVADRDLPAAGMAALGAIPFAGMLKYADEAADVAKAAMRGAKALPMDEASRMARAAEQGFTQEVYHGTRATKPFDEFRPQMGQQRHDIPGVHVGTKEAAQERLEQYFGGKSFGLKNDLARSDQAASVMPLRMKAEKPFVNKSGAPYTEGEIRQKVTAFAKKEGLKPDSYDAKIRFRNSLVKQGYDVVPYVNTVEDPGNISYLVLKPENLRSRFAQFDPANIGKAGLMGGLAAMLGGAAMRQQPSQPDR